MTVKRRSTVARIKADPTLPFVPLTLKGEKYRLVYSFNALAEAEELTGLNMFHGLNLKMLTLSQLRAMLWSTLQVSHKGITLEQVGALIAGPVECNLALDAVALAWMASMPKGDGKSPN